MTNPTQLIEQLVAALEGVSKALAWLNFGDCRAINNAPIPAAKDAYQTALKALTATRAHLKQPTEPAPSTAGEATRTAMDVTIEDDALSLLHDMVAPAFEDDKECTPVRLLLGDGHSGYGLYAASADYPEEGAVLLASVKAPATLLQSTALPEKTESAIEKVERLGRELDYGIAHYLDDAALPVGELTVWVNADELNAICDGKPTCIQVWPDEGMKNGGYPNGSAFYNTKLSTARPQPMLEPMSHPTASMQAAGGAVELDYTGVDADPDTVGWLTASRVWTAMENARNGITQGGKV